MLAVPSATLSLCDALDQLCAYTWKEISAGHSSRQPLDEESVTNYNLMRLVTAVPSVIAEKHSKPKESRSGADWEWWIGRPGSFVGFRFQAKIVNPQLGIYKHLYHKKSEALKQVDKLIDGSEKSSPQTYPLFCFYNFLNTSAHSVSSIPCRKISTNHDLAGWTVISAYALRSILSVTPTKSFDDFAPLMVPIRCLHCCPKFMQLPVNSGESRLAVIAKSRAESLWSARDDAVFKGPTILPHGPIYVERLYKGETERQGWDDGPFARLFGVPKGRSIPNGLSRVVLVRDYD